MKIKISTILILAFICFVSTTFATPVNGNYTDTTLLAENKAGRPVVEETTIPSNVNFPAALEENRDLSIDYIHKFSESKKNYLLNIYKQGKKIFPKVTAILSRYGLPEELKVLIALESNFNGNAISRAGAVGYWQIMDDVAKEYGLKIDVNHTIKGNSSNKDERKNFKKSTIAAARYLKDRCKNLNDDLLLIVAAYNWGIGNIWNVMKKCGKAKPSFWDIKKYLPAETRNYVMNFITMNVIFNNMDKFATHSLLFDSKTVRLVTTPEISDDSQNSPGITSLQ